MATRRIDSRESTGEVALKRLVGTNIALARRGRDWTQRRLADETGLDAQQISKWERGVYKPGGEALLVLAAALGSELSWFYIDHGTAEKAAA